MERSQKTPVILESEMEKPTEAPEAGASARLRKDAEKRACLNSKGLPRWLRQSRICLQCRRPGFNPWVRKTPWRRAWQPTPELWPGEFHGQRSLAGYSPWDCRESDDEHLTFTFSFNIKTTTQTSLGKDQVAANKPNLIFL